MVMDKYAELVIIHGKTLYLLLFTEINNFYYY